MNAINMKPNLENVIQGSADVWLNGMFMGRVVQSLGGGHYQPGWYGFDHRGLRISEWPNAKRDAAIREVIAFNASQRQAA